MPQSIYCDEAGFTGNNLLDPNQPFFTFATIAIEPGAAAGIVERAVKDYRINGKELKGKDLLKFSRGQQAISYVLEACAHQTLVSAWHKRYSLASKFFEHLIEPVIADQNSLFYSAGLHRFISNILFFESIVDERRDEGTLQAFQALIRAKDPKALPTLFPNTVLGEEYYSVLQDIQAFVVIHRDIIARDIESFSGDHPLYRWLLDLSTSALFALLTTWGERFDSLLVYCDESKPLMQLREVVDLMVGRTDKASVSFEGKRQSIIFNLAEPVHFVPSTDCPGVQLADVVSSALAYCLQHPGEKVSRSWMQRMTPQISEFSVFPDVEMMDLTDEKPFVNALLLRELVDRSAKGQDLFEGIPEFIRAARERHAIEVRRAIPLPGSDP